MLTEAFDKGLTNRVEKLTTPSIDADIDLFYCGIENCIPDFTCGPYIRHFYLIHYIIKGEGYYICNQKKYDLKPGDVFTIFPKDLTYYASNSDNTWSFCWFAFNGKKAVDILETCGINKNSPTRHMLLEYALDKPVKDLLNCFSDRNTPVRAKLQSHLYLIFSKMQENFLKTDNQPHQRNCITEYIENAVVYIDYNYMKPLTIKQIADYVGLERTYFSKIFSLATGSSPQSYLIRYRLEKAVHLMSTTNYSMKQIGLSVGIPNEYYFSRLFKKLKHISPREFKMTISK